MQLPAGAEARAPLPQENSPVQRQLVRLVLDNAGTSTAAVTVLAIALGILLREAIPRPVLSAWLAINLLLAGGRVAAAHAFQKKNDADAPEDLVSTRAYRALVYATGLVWGAGAWILFPEHSPLHQVVYMIIMAGLAAGAVPILSPLLRLYYAYSASFLVPVAARLILQGQEIYITLGILTILFLVTLINSATRMQELLVATLENQLRNEAMVASLKAAREAALAASRAKNEFLANMSHEIRTPMNGVLGTLQLLRDTPMESDQRDLVATANTSAESLLHLLDDILDFSRIEAGKLALQQVPFSLAELIQGLKETLAPPLGQRPILLTTEVDPAFDEPILGDPGRVRQVVGNLLSNAIKFTPAGQITVRAVVTDRRGEDLTALLEVRDTGAGIAPNDQSKLFQSFSQGDASLTRKHGGSGLGLAIVRQLTNLMGGECGLESELGEGSRFWCEIPFTLAGGAALVEEAPLPSAGGAALAGEVLLVEDNLINQKIAARMLRKLGLEVTLAADGQEALDLLRCRSFSAVLMDCQMPVMDGYAATAAWREVESGERRPRTPVIAMTAHAMEGDRDRCLAAGMDDYLAKPVKWEALAAMLRQWLPAGAPD